MTGNKNIHTPKYYSEFAASISPRDYVLRLTDTSTILVAFNNYTGDNLSPIFVRNGMFVLCVCGVSGLSLCLHAMWCNGA